MAKGWDGIEEQAAAREAREAEFQSSKVPRLRVNANNPGPITVRFLEQGPDVHNYPVHEYKVVDAGKTFSRYFTCLSEVGQTCPGCTAGMRVKRRGVFNLIQRQRPQLRKGQDGKALKNPDGSWVVDGWADEVVVIDVGGPTAEMLRKTDGTYQGLMSRDFTAQFSGDKFQPWAIFPAVDAQGNAMATPMSEADHALAAQKHNLDEVMKPPSFQDAARIVAQYGSNSGAQSGGAPGAPPAAATQHGPGTAQAGANGFLAAPAGAQPNAFGGMVPPVAPGTPPVPPTPAAPQQQAAPPVPAPAPTPAPAPAPTPPQQ